MTETWGKWTPCKNKPSLKKMDIVDVEIHYLGYEIVVVEYYNEYRWDPTGKEIRCVKQYKQEEWEKIQNGKIS